MDCLFKLVRGFELDNEAYSSNRPSGIHVPTKSLPSDIVLPKSDQEHLLL